MSSHDKTIALSWNDSCLRLSDVHLLNGPYWLNDSLISFYFEYLQTEIWRDAADRFLFVSSEVTQCIKMVPSEEVGLFLEPLRANERDFLFFAVNDNADTERAGGTHWSLLVYSRPKNTFWHYDSSQASNLAHAKALADILSRAFECPHAAFKEGACLQQTNSYDCGIHVLCQTDALARHAIRHGRLEGAKPARIDVIKAKRNELLNTIVDLGGRIK